MESTKNENAKAKQDGDIELKWWEKKKGITINDKKKKLQGKLDRKARRERERNAQGQGDRLSEGDQTAKQSDGHQPKASQSRRGKNDSVRGNARGREQKKNYQQRFASDSKKEYQKEEAIASMTGSLFSLSSLDEAACKIIEDFEIIVNSVYPLTSKQRALLPAQIRSLSHELTDEREDRRMGYMNETTALSAYIHYYLWWNIVRLSRVFSNLPDSFFNLKDGSVCLDIGSGPLTIPIALFLSRPELREKKITFYCMDLSAQALQAGENIFLAVAASLQCEAWKIIRVCASLGDMQIKQKADLVCSANLFNELMQNQESDKGQPPDYLAKKYSTELLKYIEKKNDDARIFISEPGVPSCGRLISRLRDAFMKRHFYPVAPCPHYGNCPMEGKRGGKWCNYSFSTEDAPESLRHFSRSIYIPKERAVLSFLALEKKWKDEEEETSPAPVDRERDLNQQGKISFRISSDPIRLPGNRTGYYACSPLGLLLAVSDSELRSGDLLEVEADHLPDRRDEKTGALMLNIC